MGVTVKFDGDAFERKAMEAAAKGVRQLLASVRCPEHGETPRLSEGSAMPTSFGVCCQKLRDAVERAMK